jgi:transcription termination factor Rho
VTETQDYLASDGASAPSGADAPSGGATNGTASNGSTGNGAPTATLTADAPEGAAERPRRAKAAGGGLSSMVLADLQQLAGGLGIAGVGRLRKGQLIAAIQTAQNPSAQNPSAQNPSASSGSSNGASSSSGETRTAPEQASAPAAESGTASTSTASTSSASAGSSDAQSAAASTEQGGSGQPRRERPPRQDRDGGPNGGGQGGGGQGGGNQNGGQNNQNGNRQQNGGQRNNQGGQGNPNQGGQGGQNGPGQDDDDRPGGRNARRNRYRDRRNRGRGGQGLPDDGGADPVVREDDVLVPVAGIVHVLDNYAFIRTSGYLAGSNDIYVSLSQVRRYGIRPGDAVIGAVKARGEGDRAEKYNPLVRLDTVNGLEPEEAKKRPEFAKLVPLYPQDRLRLETDPNVLTTRVIDLVAPIGKGQRGLIVSPPKAGKTMVLQAIANAITVNNPEVHLMVVLVDERPEEVTDMQRSVKGEVIASTFDRPPQDHTTIAELAIERAKRLVELGHDVVVLLDSLTRLGRAYNLAAPASGRILTGGVDSAALYPPKRFLGAARNIEGGGSLTILATALVETGSAMDTVIFEEFKGTGNMELKLDRKLADKRIFPAIDVDSSGTRKEEILLDPQELQIVIKLRRVLSALDREQSIELLLDRMKNSKSNIEFLMQVQKTTPGADN